MKRDWSQVNRQNRVRKSGSERMDGTVEPLTGSNARGYSSRPRYITVLCPLCERHIPKRQEFDHARECRAVWESKVAKPDWIHSEKMFQLWKNLLHAEHRHEHARVVLMLRCMLEAHAIERTRPFTPSGDGTTAIQRYAEILRTRDQALGATFQQIHSDLIRIQESPGTLDESIAQEAKARAIGVLASLPCRDF